MKTRKTGGMKHETLMSQRDTKGDENNSPAT